MRILFYVSVFLFVIPFGSYAQEDQVQKLKSVIPPSPNAAALGKFGDWPVNLYTGLPTVTIPLFTLAGREITVPISLDYHASGIRVGEIASWVGLGWSLNAGGVISRSIRGVPDEEPFAGYLKYRTLYTDPANLNSAVLPTAPPGTWQTHRVEAAQGSGDSEQDSYNLSANGRSYKLLFAADGSIVTMPFSLLKITVDPATGTWVVLLEDGSKLTFGSGTNFYEVATSTFGNLGTVSYKSAWYLKEIASPLGELVTFTYDHGSIAYDYTASQTDFIEYSTNGGGTAGGITVVCDNFNEGAKTTVSRQNSSSVTVHSIESTTERIDFIADTASRQDVQNGHSLSKVKRFSKLTNKYLDEFSFQYSYSQAATSNKAQTDPYGNYRLKLNSVSKGAPGTSEVQKWVFDYNTEILPARTSFAQDHWGYYNGAVTNTSFLPPMFKFIPARPPIYQDMNIMVGFMPGMHDLGANKETDPLKIKAESLSKITYPTGGSTTFDFEANSVPGTKELLVDTTIYIDKYLSSGLPYMNSISIPFTISSGQYVFLQTENYVSPSVLQGQPGAKVTASVYNSNGDPVPALVGEGQRWFVLRTAGTYTFNVTTNVAQNELETPTDYVDMHASLKWKKSKGTIAITKYIGGLRIKSITDDDGVSGSPAMTRYFVYEQPYIISPISESDYYTELYRDQIAQQNFRCKYLKMVRSSSTRYSLGSIQGGTVGYGKVTTLHGTNGVNGKTVSYFSNQADNGIYLSTVFPFPPVDNRDWRRGTLLTKLEHNASGDLLRRSANSYSYQNGPALVVFKAGYLTTNAADCTDPYNYCGIQTSFYTVSTETVRQLTQREVSYTKNASNQVDSLELSTTFFYDNPANVQATRTETTDSEGRIVKELKRTVLEKASIQSSTGLSTAASQAIDMMLTKNMIGSPIETEHYVGSTLVSKSLTNYAIRNTDKILPSDIMIQNGTGVLEKRLEYIDYDANYNLIEQKKSSDISHSYIWGYSGKYPIAEVTNAAKSNIFYTGFEDAGEGNSADNDSFTGLKSKTNGFSRALTGLTNGKYILSYRKKVSGSWILVSLPVTVTTSSYTINLVSTIQVDDVRFHPAIASMITVTHDPGIGMTSMTDQNNVTTLYQYDVMGRLTSVKDDQGRVLKTYKYHYKQ